MTHTITGGFSTKKPEDMKKIADLVFAPKEEKEAKK